MNQLVNPEMTVMNELSLAHLALVRALFEMGPLVSPQTLHPSKPLTTDITAVRLLSGVDVLVSPQVTWN